VTISTRRLLVGNNTQGIAIDEEGPSRERISRERVMGRELVDGHRRGKAESRAYVSVERAMGRQRREQRTSYALR
jgi:hypothetical protein